MKQLTQSEIRKNGKVYKNVSSPATEGVMKQVTDIVENNGVFSVSTDGGETYSPAGGDYKNLYIVGRNKNDTNEALAFNGSMDCYLSFDKDTFVVEKTDDDVLEVKAKGTAPEALPQEASALKSGNLPTSGWTATVLPLWEGTVNVQGSYKGVVILPPNSLNFNKLKQYTTESDWQIWTSISSTYEAPLFVSVSSSEIMIGGNDKSFKIKSDGSLYGYNGSGSNIVYKGLKCLASSRHTFSISDANITVNSDVLMELTDEGMVTAYALANGNIQVIRDAMPTYPIQYTYKVKQTNATGQFTLVNHFVPSIPVTSVNGQTGAVTIAVPTKTSELENDSNFATTANIPTKTSQLQNDSGFVSVGEWKEWTSTSVLTEEGLYEIVTTEYPNDGNKTFFVQYEQGKPNNGACWVSVLTAGSVTVVSPICSGDGTLRVARSGSGSSTTEPLSFKYRKITN